jgi:hypothetical protein
LSRIILAVFTAPLHSNGRGADHVENSLSTVEVFAAATCLSSRYLAMGIHVTITMLLFSDSRYLMPQLSQFIAITNTVTAFLLRRSGTKWPASYVLVNTELPKLPLVD